MTQGEILERFERMVDHLTPESVMPLAEVYAEDVVFEDPLHRVEGLTALSAYFARMNARIESADFVFTNRVVADGAASVEWVMTVRIRRPRQVIVVPGVSVLRIADRITHQRDYFDVGAMLYERLPVLGWLLRRLKGLVK